jgi:alkylation response protein AidB-like acyl-CoA dehydrogenase
MHYTPQPQAVQSILFDVLGAEAQLAGLAPFAEADGDLMRQVLEEAGKFVGEAVAPLNTLGDNPGCQFAAGKVTTPPGFRDAYQAFWQAGWPALSASVDDGGQGLPGVLECVLYEWLSAANHGWTMAPGLLHGAYECIRHHASDELKERYAAKIATGEWLATMCLTEPHAGSDLGLARTRGTPQPDGSYRVSGTKIFISGGEHDLTDNIIHLVLGRVPDAPAGPKGLSLFLVPKFMPDGRTNAAFCDRIEEKMGLHGSPTCVMRFDEATGWLIGEPGRGLNAMFVMMNAARLHVALQGIGLLDAAWQKADAYAHERRQMRAPGARKSAEAADLIIDHPAVQRILDTQRAWVDTSRVLAYRTGLELDIAEHHADADRRTVANRWCSLVTPVIKSICTHQAFHGASECLQVFGGHGYVKEWGIEQIVRDSRVAMIYEGTNEIQAIDLLVRKVLPDGGATLNALANDLLADSAWSQPSASLQANAEALRQVTAELVAVNAADPSKAYWVAGDYLRVTGLVLLQWAADRLAASKACAGSPQAYDAWILPELGMRMAIIRSQLSIK